MRVSSLLDALNLISLYMHLSSLSVARNHTSKMATPDGTLSSRGTKVVHTAVLLRKKIHAVIGQKAFICDSF